MMRRALPGSPLALAASLDSLRSLRRRLIQRRRDVTLLLALRRRDLLRYGHQLRTLVNDLPDLAIRSRCVGVLVEPSTLPELATLGCDAYVELARLNTLALPAPTAHLCLTAQAPLRRRKRSRMEKKAFSRYRPQALGSAADCGDQDSFD